MNNESKKVENTKCQIKLPIVIFLTLASGIFIGSTMFNQNGRNNLQKNIHFFGEILTYIERDYVDSVNIESLVEEAVDKMLEKLDPHTVYIPPKDLQLAKTQLEGDFEGIGIEFQIIKDTIVVVSPIAGGPSEAVGLKSGDKIIEIDDKEATGKQVNTQFVFSKLRGPKNTQVKLKIIRKGIKEPLVFTIVRDKIPTYSVDTYYMITDEIGYIKISRFAEKTYHEFKQALSVLLSKGMKKLMLDLKDNPGGYMDRAVNIADELLGSNQLIVYTDGKDLKYDNRFYAHNVGSFENGALVVLVNEASASASEILAGAIQDNDRGIVVGRRTYGKGLVQMPIPLSDGGELRLTISRYYTPSGRCIQKPYAGNLEDYEMDLLKRYEHGEFFSKDSIKLDQKLLYKTVSGRNVYGGGGIMPDFFVPRDTSYYSNYLGELYNKGVIREFALNFVNDHKKSLEKMSLNDFKSKFEVNDKILNELIDYASKSNIPFNPLQFKKSKKIIQNSLKAFIAKGIWKQEGFYSIINEIDEIYCEGLKRFDEAEKLVKRN